MAKSRKKLFLVITKSNWGGAQRYVFDLANNLYNKYELTVVMGAPRSDTIESGKGVLLEKLRTKGIKTIEIPELKKHISIREEFVVFFKLIKLFWQERPDIVHLNSSKIGGLGTLAARLTFVRRIIFTVHGWPFLEKRSKIERKMIYFLSWLTAIFSHKTIVIGKNDFEIGLRMKLVRNKLRWITNGIEPHGTLSRGDTRTIIAQHIEDQGLTRPPIDGFWIGSISELVPNKGLEYAIRAFKEARQSFNKTYYFIIGGGEEGEKLKKQIDAEGLNGKVFLLGFIPNASGLLPAFDLLTLTSLKEGLPYVLLEAGCTNTPVLASDVGEVPAVIIDRETGILTKPGDVESIHSGLILALSDSILRNSLAKNLRVHVLENFSLEKMLRETVEVYESKK